MHRTAGWIVVVAGLTGLLPAGASAGRTGAAELKVAERLDGLLNAGKPAEAAGLFAEGATARTPDGTPLAGRTAIAGWLGSLPGLRMDSGNRQAWDGGRVTWATSVSHDRLKALGIAPLAASAELVVRDGMIASWSLRWTAESRLKLADATAKEQEALFRSALVPALAGPELQAALPDLKLAADDVVVANDRVAAKGKLTGTWTGPYFGVTGTGQPVSVDFQGSARVSGGAVAEPKLLFDAKALYDQLGFIVTRPAPVRALKPVPVKPASGSATTAGSSAAAGSKPAPATTPAAAH